jgi:alpha-ketoglutarate-dependent taurine dioxygenase
MRTRRSAIDDLRTAIDCLPLRTKEAMLTGIRTNDIIVGAYTDRDGGVCPMLAAHRNGGRTSFISFARAWDAFARPRRARRATRRELAVLEAHLEASILAETDRTELGEHIADHQQLMRDRRTREAARTGFGWLHDLTYAPEPEAGRELARR